MLDGRIASDYYSDPNAGSYIVYPSNGVRISDGMIWKEFETYNDRSTSDYICSYGTISQSTNYTFVSRSDWRGGNIYTTSGSVYFPSCYYYVTDWHTP